VLLDRVATLPVAEEVRRLVAARFGAAFDPPSAAGT